MTNHKETNRNLLPLFGISFSISAGCLLLSWLLFMLTGNTSYYILSFLAVILSFWYGHKKAGLLTTLFTGIGIYIFFVHSDNFFSFQQMPKFLDLILFLGGGILTNIVLDRIQYSQDIRMYKQKEKEYLEHLANLQRDNARFEKEVKARDEFLSIASHELKTPLSAMLLQIQTALYNIRNVSLANFSVDKLLKMLQSTEQQTKRLSKMINDLLNISLITTGKLDLEKEEVNLAQLTKDVVERFAERAEREGSPIEFLSEKNVIGDWDKLRIEQAVTNLITNAMKYGDNKPITVAVGRANGMGTITVSDRGIGIPEDRQERIFERFERAVSNHNYKGLGVGLYITHHIVRTHQGKISLRSKPNDGSSFTIELPLRQAPNVQKAVV